MRLSEYAQAKKRKEYENAKALYKLGHSYRTIAKMLGYSHQWVANAVKFEVKSEGVDN